MFSSEAGGGWEDPRISFVEPLQHYVMTYTALSRRGPRIAIAISEDLITKRRLSYSADVMVLSKVDPAKGNRR